MYRSEVSRAYASISMPGRSDLSNQQSRPAMVTQKLMSDAEKSIHTLISFQGYHESLVGDPVSLFFLTGKCEDS